MTIQEPSSNPQAATAPARHGKGKQKLPEYTEPVLDSSEKNGTDFSLLDNFPIPCHLFDKDDNFRFAISILNSDFFEAESECSSSSINNVSTSNNSSGILLRISLFHYFLALLNYIV